MAYDDSCVGAVRVPRFSTPDKLYLKQKLGSATADNARKIQENVVRRDNIRVGAVGREMNISKVCVGARDRFLD